jgi:NAD(P)-dependent dehydrogenase (short-subunit alcohol dehydrogenase family)
MTDETTLRLDARTAVITGAAGLIGSALAAGFAANGADVVLVDHDADGLARVAAAIDSKTTQLSCDITDAGAVQRLADTVVERFGHIDVLVNNAGGNRRVHPDEVSEEDWTYVTNLNLRGTFLMCQRFGRQMIAQRRGSIVNISSTCGCSAMGRGNFVFSIAKAGVNHMSRELALEWGASGVRVNVIAPSQVDSPGMREWMDDVDTDGSTMGAKFLGGVPLGRLVTAQDIVGPALFLASDAAAMVTGTIIPVDGGNLTANIAGTVGAPIPVDRDWAHVAG